MVEAAKEAIAEAFNVELTRGTLRPLQVISPCSIVAAIGDAMADTPGVSARFFSALGRAGINVLAIAQGSNQRNISAVIYKADSARALNVVHR